MKIKEVHISQIKSGDIILHNGYTRTVCKNNIGYDSLLGVTLFGDSYWGGHLKVKVVIKL